MELDDIKKFREQLGWSQRELAERAGITQSHLAKIEIGKVNPRYSTVKLVMEALDKGVDDRCTRYMTTQIIWIGEDEPAKRARALMFEKGISQLPVFEHGKMTPSTLVGFDHREGPDRSQRRDR